MTTEDVSIKVDKDRLKAIVTRLAEWPNRNTNNPTLTESAEWVAAEFRKIPGVEVEMMAYTLPKSGRVPEEKQVVQVVATVKGTSGRMLIMGGHLDTINMVEGGLDSIAPGANDDASGVAATMECARILAGSKPKHSLVFVAFSGEEQGLYGSKALAARAVKDGWKIDAVLSNDTIGASENLIGQKDKARVRIFSTDPSTELGGGSRELARWIEYVQRGKVPGFGVKLVLRNDRFGRGGDHTPFMQAGFAAVRFIEVFEEYARQHTKEDLAKYVDFDYVAKVTEVNAIALAALSQAGEPPTRVRIGRSQGHDTTISWEGSPDAEYEVFWRDSASATWQGSLRTKGNRATVKGINKDDHEFAVGAFGGVPVPAR
ncbi:MAG: hypothetical protein HONBIEJF_01710 [Fimbriimonadaceae bacterium]|nr:hypothetical protein [Fimbriimonadaceae bacterium]